MKNKFTTIIIAFVVLGIIGVLILFGIIIINEFQNTQASSIIEDFKTSISDAKNTIDTDIRAPQIVENPLDNIQGTSTSNNVNYSNVDVDKYFYNQLEEYSQTIYKAFESNKENMKTGTYKIELGTSFTSLLNQSNGQDLLGGYYQSAIEAYTYDNPDVFYLSPNKMYLNIETTTSGKNVTYNVYVDNGEQANYLTDEFNSKSQIDSAIAQIENTRNVIIADKTGNAYNDTKMVHDYLVDSISYDSSLSKENIYNIYGALINKECVCEGYARALKYLLDSIDVPSVLVIGKGTNSTGRTENHAWNYVQLNGNWYAVDTTWDDPVTTGGGFVSQSSKYKYFLKGSNEFSQDHTASGQFTEGGKMFVYPDLSTGDYN